MEIEFLCPLCGDPEPNLALLRLHFQECHVDELRSSKKCPLCGVQANTYPHLLHHLREGDKEHKAFHWLTAGKPSSLFYMIARQVFASRTTPTPPACNHEYRIVSNHTELIPALRMVKRKVLLQCKHCRSTVSYTVMEAE